ncbi:hypothetical protein CGCFRS4_v015963, partial [Colletotrichum fructicola]
PSETKNEQPDVRLIISKITSRETLILFDLFHDGYDFKTAHFQFRGQVPLQSKWMETASFQRRCPHRFGLGSSTEGFPRSRGDKEATTGRNSRSKRHSKSSELRVEVIFRSTCPILFNFLGVLFVGIMNRIITLLYRLPFSLVVLFVRASWTNYGFVLAHALEFGLLKGFGW